MPQSLSLVVIHVIFSTKERLPFLEPDTRPKLHAYLATVARNAGCECYRAGGVADQCIWPAAIGLFAEFGPVSSRDESPLYSETVAVRRAALIEWQTDGYRKHLIYSRFLFE